MARNNPNWLLVKQFEYGGAIHEFSIRVNNEPPVIKISGIDYAVEDDIWHTFDATLTEDLTGAVPTCTMLDSRRPSTRVPCRLM